MAFEQRSLDDYVDVATRIAEFRDKYPEGSLQPADPARPWEQAIVSGVDKHGQPFAMTMIVYVAAAYRTPDDPRPGVGVAWEPFPGRTPFTLGSELMNAETSAWGRAIAALGIATKQGIASRQEVQNRRAEREDGLPTNADGSLSRSRTTDEQKAAAGVMTDAQQRAHNKLRRDGEPKPGRVEKLGTTPDDDPWYRPEPERVKSAGWILSEAFAKLDIFDRTERLKQTGEIVGRDIETSKDLTAMEVGMVLEALQNRDVPA